MPDLDLDAIEARAKVASAGRLNWQGIDALRSLVESDVPALVALVRAKQSWIDGAKVDMAAMEEERAKALAAVRRLREDADEDASVRDMLASLLTSTANALKGEPEQLWMHDWSDLPQVAGQHAAGLRTLSDTVALLTRERGELLAAIARVRALCAGADDSEYTTVFAAAVLAALDVRHDPSATTDGGEG